MLNSFEPHGVRVAKFFNLLIDMSKIVPRIFENRVVFPVGDQLFILSDCVLILFNTSLILFQADLEAI